MRMNVCGVVGQQSQEAGEGSLGRGGVVRMEREQRQDDDRDDDADSVARTPARALVGDTADERAVAVVGSRKQRRSLAYLLTVSHCSGATTWCSPRRRSDAHRSPH